VDNADVTTNILQWAQSKTNCDIAIGGSREHAVQYAAKDYIISFDDDFFTGEVVYGGAGAEKHEARAGRRKGAGPL
jgi:hypothetical protein